MIAVIADDLTGAAELGGLGLRYNLIAEIATEVNPDSPADLLVISADTRSIAEEEAVVKIKRITTALLKLHPQLIYKKTDSVLRGHVVAELRAQMEVMQLSRALIVPANPYLERTIRDGQYYFKGELIHLSNFSKDPEFPILSSAIADMLRSGVDEIHVKKLHEALPASGIAVGEAAGDDDVKMWASRVDSTMVLAGAAGFFTAVLNKMQVRGNRLQEGFSNELGNPILFVCGTTFSRSRTSIREVKAKGGPVSYMPAPLVATGEPVEMAIEKWADEVVQLLSANGKAIVAIEESEASTKANANDLREKTASVVAKVLEKIRIKELVVEGGSTAASIIRKKNFTRLVPVNELSPGVVRMRVIATEDLFLTIKPGSYNWSPQLWDF